MSNSKRVLGFLNRARGQSWEQVFAAFCNANQIGFVKLPTGAEIKKTRFGQNQIKLKKSPFDYILARSGRYAFIDNKVTIDKAVSFSKVKKHQIDAFRKLSIGGARCGYVVQFRSLGQIVVFFDWKLLAALKPRQSLSPEQGMLMGNSSAFNPLLLF